MTRAILIDPDDEPTWIDLDPDARADLNTLLGGLETVVLDRGHGEDGPGVMIAIRDYPMPGAFPNAFVQRLIKAFGQNWPVHGRVVLTSLEGRDVVDLTPDTWGWLVDVESGVVAAPTRKADLA